MLERLLHMSSFHAIKGKAHVLNFSHGTSAYLPTYEDLKIAFQLLQPFLASVGVAPKEEIEHLYEQAMNEMLEEDFCALFYFLTVWGETAKADPSQE